MSAFPKRWISVDRPTLFAGAVNSRLSRLPPRDHVLPMPSTGPMAPGKINLFGLDSLVNMATADGLLIELRVLEAA